MDRTPSLLRELAHELRDALSPACSALDLMRLRAFEAEASRAQSERIRHALERALATIDAFILAEQCDNGSLSLAPTRVELAQLLELARQTVPEEEASRCRYPPREPRVTVLADAPRSAQVLGTLLAQALAAAPAQSPIEVRIAGDGGHAQVRVGFAVDPQALADPDWFESYRGAGGGGRLALRTARCLMRLQQGDVRLARTAPGACELMAIFPCASLGESDPFGTGAGSSGHDTGERRPAEGNIGERNRGERDSASGGRARAASAAGAGPARVLLVEDNAEVRRAYREALTALGYAVSEARNAEEALIAAVDPLPAVALIDVHLPGMNGYRLAQALKARTGHAMCLVMLSGVALDDVTVQLSMSAGFDRCFDKAAGPSALHALLLSLS
jgi:CheY-like chemotaxis protein